MLVRGFYFEGWDPTGKPSKERHRDEFLARIEQELRGDTRIDPERAAQSVFLVLQKYVSEGEIEDVRQVLPAQLRELWPRSQAAGTS
jgi:uncharacterized protein (DUF2267 family)